jgi:cytoskeletal protein CcmA (bactofilin family)
MARVRKFKPPKVSTVIGQGTRVSGDLTFSGGLHLDGSVTGNVSGETGGEATLTISEQGRVEGDVRVDNLILNGTIVGDVHVRQRVELASKAKVTGTVHYHLLEMAMGAEVNGQLVHADEQTAAVQGPLALTEAQSQSETGAVRTKVANT